MRRIAMVVAGLVLNAIWVYAGYESIPPPEVRGRQNVVKGERASVQVRRAGWGGGVVFADGTERSWRTQGAFPAVTLESWHPMSNVDGRVGTDPRSACTFIHQCGG